MSQKNANASQLSQESFFIFILYDNRNVYVLSYFCFCSQKKNLVLVPFPLSNALLCQDFMFHNGLKRFWRRIFILKNLLFYEIFLWSHNGFFIDICMMISWGLFFILNKVLSMSSSFWLLGVESHYFFHAEKERIACKAEQIQKMTTIFTQNDNLEPFWLKIVVILWICSALQAVLSFSHDAVQLKLQLKWLNVISPVVISLDLKEIGPEMVFCYNNCSNVLWEKIVLVWGKKLRKKFANSRP